MSSRVRLLNPPAVRRFGPPALRVAAAVAVLIAVLVKIGDGPFLRGVQSLAAPALLFAFAATAVTTVCSAWRWSLVARGLGVELPLRAAVPAYYRSQFLNSVLPGGVVGDVQRAVVHGRQAGDLSRGLRAVAWERVAGQCVQVVLAILVLLVFPSPVRHFLPVVLAVLGAAVAIAAAVLWRTRRLRLVRIVIADVRAGVLARGILARIVLASVVVSVGHAAVFVAAAWSVGSGAEFSVLVPLAMLVQLAMTIPLTVGGWGPREGIAAWAFAAAGLGASTGVAVTTAYGLLALAAVLPGAVILAGDAVHRVLRAQPVERVAHG